MADYGRRQRTRDKQGRYSPMTACDRCGSRTKVYPQGDPASPTWPEWGNKHLCVKCETALDEPQR